VKQAEAKEEEEAVKQVEAKEEEVVNEVEDLRPVVEPKSSIG